MFYLKRVVFILHCLIFIYIPTTLNAQIEGDSVLFDYVSRQDLNLDSVQSSKLDTMINNIVYADHYYVKINRLSEIHDEGNIYVNLPTGDSLNYFHGQQIEFDTIDEVTYYGVLRGPQNCIEPGYLQIYAGDNKVFGAVNIGGEEYQIHDLGENQNVLFKIDSSLYNKLECATNDTTHSADSIIIGDNYVNLRTVNKCIVSVLILYTEAAAKVVQPTNRGKFLFHLLKLSSIRSDADVEFHLDGIAKLDDFVEDFPDGTYTLDELRKSVRTTLDNLTNDVKAKHLRENVYSSDLVILLTDGNWEIGRKGTPAYRKTYGIANLNNFTDKDFAFAIAEADIDNTTLAHEAFHLFGCKHNNDIRTNAPFVYESRGHNMGKIGPNPLEKITLMHVNTNDTWRDFRLSNPDISVNGIPTGVIGESENEKQASNRACPISDYFPLTIPVTSFISGPMHGNNSGAYTWCAEFENCTNLSHVIWSYSYNGFDYSYLTTQYPGSSYCITKPMPYDKDIYFKINVVCYDNNMFEYDESFIYVYNSDQNNCDPLPILNEVDDSEQLSNNDIINVNPNPVSDFLNINVNLQEVSSINLEVIDISGNVVSELMKNYKVQNLSTNINIAVYPAGIYFIVLQKDNKTYTKRFIKQ